MGNALLDWVALCGEVLATRGRAGLWNRSSPSVTAFNMARHRLMKNGLLVAHRRNGLETALQLTPKGVQQVSEALQPQRFWDQKWTGIWSVLVYDVPEKQHAYRTTLRSYLQRLRMGKLQGSVWISARDVRPDFADLQVAAGVNDYALLFAARHVLGQSGATLAQRAWDFERLQSAHAWFLDTIAATGDRLKTARGTPPELIALLRELHGAYLTVMERDPLLPAALWPPGYLGPQVHQAYLTLARQLAGRL
ncbi:MAG: hypothetical protein NTV49_15560 [Kiritimatiellaeota bacterium]|nr:hypothetical protein [Kiritimatiellota bacterium]